MALNYSVALRNAQLDAVETTVGTSAKLYLRTGTKPTACADADSGTLLATLDLPSDWMAAASSGSKAKSATAWTGTGADSGSAGHFRIKDSGATTCYLQGSITATGGGGDMTLDNIVIASAQTITISTFTLTAGNA
jgi:hypothetical protein